MGHDHTVNGQLYAHYAARRAKQSCVSTALSSDEDQRADRERQVSTFSFTVFFGRCS
jgi:hypothetical protein